MMSDFMHESDLKRAQPLRDCDWLEKVTRWMYPGQGTTVGFEELSKDDPRLGISPSGVPIDQGLKKITDEQRRTGIWANGRIVIGALKLQNKKLTHWSEESGLPVAMPLTGPNGYRRYSTLVGNGSSGELMVKWRQGNNLGVSYTPGIRTEMGFAFADCLHYTKKFGVDFGVVIDNPTHSFAFDLVKAYLGESKLGCITQAGLETRRVMLSFLEKNPQAELVHFCHSNGALHTKHALESLPEHIRKRIIVIAIGPQCLISDELCKKAYHVGSNRDWVYGRAIRNKGKGNFSYISRLESNVERDWDHTPRSGTLRDKIAGIIKEIQSILK